MDLQNVVVYQPLNEVEQAPSQKQTPDKGGSSNLAMLLV
jgi:hypothetical protein